MTKAESYRPDLDGLRAVAVVAVVAYHFGLAPFAGGFVGVDIFFVISGFLINSIITREAKAGGFSLLAFYGRRIKRVFPALLVVIAATLVVGWFLLLPADYESLGAQSAAAALGVSNFYFMWNTGYFDRAADLLPLLHTWSLGVEEQFYLVWPALFLLAWKVGNGSSRAMVGVLAAIAIVSLGLSVFYAANVPQTAFYMLHTRAFELALGALLAFAPTIRRRWLIEAGPAVGLALIAGSVVLLHDGLPFPGWNAVPPCLGTALVIWPAGRPSIIARLLSLRPLVFVGLISYSVYLWHWPLIVYFRHYTLSATPSATELFLLVAATIVLAVLSWRLVEVPFRRAPARSFRTFGVGLTGMAAVAIAGTVVLSRAGFPSRLPPGAERYALYLNEVFPDSPNAIVDCFNRTEADGQGGWVNDCLALSSGPQQNVLVLGDSHAAHFRIALPAAFPQVHFISATTSGCRPVVRPAADPRDGTLACRDGFQHIFNDIIPRTHYDAIILSARWRNGEADQIRETVDYLQQFIDRVIVFGQTLEYKTDVPVALSQAFLPRRGASLSELSRYPEIEVINDLMLRLLAGSNAEYYSPLDALCPAGAESCRVLTDDGIPFQRDYGHFTFEGANQMIEMFRAQGLAF